MKTDSDSDQRFSTCSELAMTFVLIVIIILWHLMLFHVAGLI